MRHRTRRRPPSAAWFGKRLAEQIAVAARGELPPASPAPTSLYRRLWAADRKRAVAAWTTHELILDAIE